MRNLEYIFAEFWYKGKNGASNSFVEVMHSTVENKAELLESSSLKISPSIIGSLLKNINLSFEILEQREGSK